MSDGILKKIEGNIGNAKKAIISNPANLAREANILGKNQNGESSVFTQEQFINTLAGTPINGNEDKRKGGYGFTEAQAQAAWDFLNIYTEGNSAGELDEDEINFWINTYGADTDGVEENGNDTFSVSNLLSVIGIADSNGKFINSNQVSTEILNYLENLESEGYDIDARESGQGITVVSEGQATEMCWIDESTGEYEFNLSDLTIAQENEVMQDLYESLTKQQTDLTQIDENTMMEMLYNATMTDSSTDTEESKQTSAQFLQQFGISENIATALVHEYWKSKGIDQPEATDSTGEAGAADEEATKPQGQEAPQTDSTSPQTQEDLFKNAGLNGDLAQTRITVSEGIYTFTTDKYSDSKKDNLDCGSRIMRNIYGVSYSDQQYTGCYEALSILNGYGGDIPANAKFEVYSLKDLQTAAAEIANGTPIDEIKAKIAPLSEIKETSEPEATAVLHDENTETTPENYKEELDLRLAELNETLDGNEGTDKNGLKSLVEGLQLPDTNKVSVSAALEAAYYLTGGNSETLQELLSEDSLTRDELASIAGSEQYAYSQDHTLQPGDIVFRYGEDGTLLPSTVYDCDENGKLLVVQGGQTTGNGTSNGIYIKEVGESEIKYVIPCGQEARTKAEAAEAETQTATEEARAQTAAEPETQTTTAKGEAQTAAEEEALIATVQSEYGDMLEELQITSTISKAEESEDGSLSLSFDDGTTAKISDEQIITYDEQNNPIAGVNLTEDGIAEFLDENATLEINELGLNNPTFNARGGIITATDEDGKVATFSQDGKIKDITEASGIQTMKDGVEIPYAKAAQELFIFSGAENLNIDNENNAITFNQGNINYIFKKTENGYTYTTNDGGDNEITETYTSEGALSSIEIKGNPDQFFFSEAGNVVNNFKENYLSILNEAGINSALTKISFNPDGTTLYTLEDGTTIEESSIDNNHQSIITKYKDGAIEYSISKYESASGEIEYTYEAVSNFPRDLILDEIKLMFATEETGYILPGNINDAYNIIQNIYPENILKISINSSGVVNITAEQNEEETEFEIGKMQTIGEQKYYEVTQDGTTVICKEEGFPICNVDKEDTAITLTQFRNDLGNNYIDEFIHLKLEEMGTLNDSTISAIEERISKIEYENLECIKITEDGEIIIETKDVIGIYKPNGDDGYTLEYNEK